jgi:hypothetical protein
MSRTVEMEIVRAGTYPQGALTVEDLEEIAESYEPAVHEAPLVLDHPPKADQEHRGPAYGWVEGLRRAGETLVARIRQVPEELKSLVESGRYKHRSAEIYLDFQGGGKKYLKRIALLGAAVPEVKGLAPITFAEDGGPSLVVEFEGWTPEAPSETDDECIRRLVETEVARAKDELEASLAERFTARLAEKDEEIQLLTERAEQAERIEVAAFCERLVRQGKASPAEAKELEAALLALPNDPESTTTCSASGGDENLTPRARLMQLFEARVSGSAVPLGEVSADASRASRAVALGDGDDRIRVPKTIVTYFEMNREDFERMGVTLEDYARSELHHSA